MRHHSNNGSRRRKSRRSDPSRRLPSFQLLEDRRMLATFTVTSLADGAPDATDGLTTLREAIIEANDVTANPEADSIAFQLGLTGRILLDPTQGELLITDDLTITGTGAAVDLVIDAQANSRVIRATDAVSNLTLDSLTIENGRTTGSNQDGDGGGISAPYSGATTLTNSTVSGNTSSGNGGGIDANVAVTLTNSTVSGNTAEFGFGGGILTREGGLTVTDSTISGNYGSLGGGGIFNEGTAAITNSTLSGNSQRSGAGGGILNEGTATITNSTLSGNSAYFGGGGGIFNFGTATITNSTLSGNSADNDGGGSIFNRGIVTITNSTLSGNSAGYGGSISNFGTATITNSTVSENSAVGVFSDGGGIFNNGTATITNSTLSENSADSGGGIFNRRTATISNSIVVNSQGGDDIGGSGSFGGSHNLIGDGSRLSDFTDSIEGDPMLGPLVDNGGPTLTHALLPNSPAIDTGNNALAVDGDGNALLTDQRGDGFDRILSGTVDIGAFEFDPTAVLIGDVDQNGLVNLFDIAPFIDVITTQGFQDEADINQDGMVNLFDIAPFIELLTSGQVPNTALPTFTVTNISDGPVTAAGDSPGSLRQAIFDANVLPGADTITFDSSVFTGGDASLIRLTNGELEISDSLTISAPSSLGVTITGDANGDDITTAGNITDVVSSFGGTAGATDDLLDDNSRVINFSAELGELTIEGLTITGGRTTGEEIFSTGERVFGGAGIRSVGIVNLNDSTVIGNSTTGRNADGGGIVAFNTVTLNNSAVDKNSAFGRSADGGGIGAFFGSDVTLNNSTVSGNSSGDDGAGIYLTSGKLTLNSSTVAGNASGDDGGGIAVLLGGDVTLTNSTVSGNTAVRSLLSINSADGGGIAVSLNGDVTLTNSTVSRNTVSGSGGGISSESNVTLTNSTVSGNTGGGVLASSVTLTNSTVSGNTPAGIGGAGNGGGINARSNVTLDNSTVSGNTTTGDGGGIYTRSGDVTLTNSTVSGNTAAGTVVEFAGLYYGTGGGIFSFGSVSLTNSTVSGNMAAGDGGGIVAPSQSSTINNSIVAGNVDSGVAPDIESDDIVAENSIIGDTTGTTLTAGNNNQLNVDISNVLETEVVGGVTVPLLTDNGGPVETIALLANSPAIDAGDNALAVDADGNALITDQRGAGFDRILSGTVDIGAFEFQPSAFLLGDVDQNGVVDLFDISPFIGVITSQGFQDEADINQDGVVDLFDIAPFIGLLTSPATNSAITQSNAESSADLLDTDPESFEEIQNSERDEIFEELLV